MVAENRIKSFTRANFVRTAGCYFGARNIVRFASALAALAMSQCAWAGDYWNGNGDGYWESNGGDANDNWDSGSDAGYFFTNGVYGTKTVKFNSPASFDTPVSIGGAENGTADDDPIVFLADADGYGFTTTADLKVGDSNIGHLWIKRGTFKCKALPVGNADNTGSLPLKIGGGDDKVAVSTTSNVDVNKGTMLITTNGTFCVGGLLRPGKVADLHGELMIDGGVVTNTGRYLSIADVVKSSGTVTVKNGGKYCNINSDGEGIAVGQRGYGTLEILSGGEVNTTKRITLCTYNNTTAAVRIADGGLLVMPEIRGKDSLNGPASLTINGGTIRANGNNKTLIPKHDNLTVTVGASGGTIDNNGKNITINADLLGEGYMTLIGSGKTTIGGLQTGTGALNVNAGTVAVDGGVTVARPMTVANGATLTVNATAQATVNTLTLESGSALNIASYAGTDAALAVTTLTLPDSVAVPLTLNGGAFPVGTYKILEKTGIAVADVDGKLVPSTGNESRSYSVSGNTLVLTVGTPAHCRWRASATTGNFSDPGNWEDGQMPVAGETLDFSGVTANTTINCDIENGPTYQTLVLGTEKIVTIQGNLNLSTLTNANKLAIASGATLTVTGDVVITSETSADQWAFDTNNGTVDVRGHVLIEGAAKGYICGSGNGTFKVKGIVNNSSSDAFKFNAKKDKNKITWFIGADGCTGDTTQNNGNVFWVDKDNTYGAVIRPLADFTIGGLYMGVRAPLEFNTSDEAGNGHVITIDTVCYRDSGSITVSGAGTVLVKYDTTVSGKPNNKEAFNGAVTVTNAATLAINAGKKATTGAITVNDGATLQVAESAVSKDAVAVTLGGNLTLKAGAQLGFNYTNRNAPKLDLTDKTVTFDEGPTTNVVVKISATAGKRGFSGNNVLTAGGKFAGVKVTLASGAPDWALGVDVVNGEIVLDVKPQGTVIRFR